MLTGYLLNEQNDLAFLVPKPTALCAVPGVSPGRGLLI